MKNIYKVNFNKNKILRLADSISSKSEHNRKRGKSISSLRNVIE